MGKRFNNTNKDKTKTRSKSKPVRRRRRTDDSDLDTSRNNDIPNLNNDIKLRTNDPSWYTHNISLADNASTIPFSYALGTKLYGYASNKYIMPGLCALRVVPCIGKALYRTDPVNVAATQIYSYVRHANSGSKNYEAADLMMYMLAMDQLYSCHEWLKRMFGYLNTYSVTNKYIPRAYAEADYIDFDDFIDHKANLHYFINEMAIKLTALAIPQTLDLFKRHRYIYSNIHVDDVSSRAGLYMFTPVGFYKYDNTTSQTGTSLQWEALKSSGSKYTFSELTDYVNGIMNPIFGDEDSGTMSGDILKAYGKEGIFQAEAITLEYSVLPLYDETILSQIHNATVYAGITPRPINQTPSGIIQNQQLVSTSTLRIKENSTYALLDTHLDNPTASDVLEMSRLTARIATIADRDDVLDILGGSELVGRMNIYTFNYDTNSYDKQVISGSCIHIPSSYAPTILSDANKLTKFKNHPLLQLINDTTNEYIIIGDMDNVTTVSYQQLDNLHSIALMSLFGV